MELKQLESFVAVVVYKSFTEAAKQLYISQPTISTHIQALEKELESKLIIRTTKSIELTPRGVELYDCAVKMLDLRDSLLEKWKSSDENVVTVDENGLVSFVGAGEGFVYAIHKAKYPGDRDAQAEAIVIVGDCQY